MGVETGGVSSHDLTPKLKLRLTIMIPLAFFLEKMLAEIMYVPSLRVRPEKLKMLRSPKIVSCECQNQNLLVLVGEYKLLQIGK